MPLPSDPEIVIITQDDTETPAEGVPAVPPPITNADIYIAIQRVGDLAAQGVRRTEELSSEVLPRLGRLELRVFGSHPPPLMIYAPPKDGELVIPSPKPSTPPLTKRQTLSESAIETLGQELSNFRGEMRRKLDDQSRVMGIAPTDAAISKARAYLFSRAGMKDAITLATLVAAIVGAVLGGRAAASVPASNPPAATLQP